MSQISLRGFDNFSRLDAAGTNLLASVAASRKLNANRLQIGIEPPSGFVISVGYVVSKLRAFPTYVAAFSHISASINKVPSVKSRNKIYSKEFVV